MQTNAISLQVILLVVVIFTRADPLGDVAASPFPVHVPPVAVAHSHDFHRMY
jgi:hypothetical protein